MTTLLETHGQPSSCLFLKSTQFVQVESVLQYTHSKRPNGWLMLPAASAVFSRYIEGVARLRRELSN